MEKSSKNNYDLLYAAFLKAYPSKPKQQSQKEFNLKWNELKSDKANLQKNVDSLMIEYRDISLKHTGKLMSYWSTLPKQNVSTASAHPPESLPLELWALLFPVSYKFKSILSTNRVGYDNGNQEIMCNKILSTKTDLIFIYS